MDNRSSIPRRLVLGGVVVGLAVAVALFLRGVGSPESSMGKATAKVERLERGASDSLPNARLPVLPPQLPPMPDELIERLLEKDKKLGLFMQYHKIVVLDAPRRDEYRKLLSSPEMMTAMAQELMDPGSGKVEREEYYHRLMQIDYFEAALSWKDNPQREKVLDLTRDIITKDNFADQDDDRRQMLGGTKMELYRLLYAQDARRAHAMVAQAKGTRMEPLVSWMADEEIRRHTREEAIRQETAALQEQAN